MLGDIQKRNNGRLGKKHSEKTKRKMSEIRIERKKRLGYLISKEARKKISEANKGKISWAKGKKLSEETK